MHLFVGVMLVLLFIGIMIFVFVKFIAPVIDENLSNMSEEEQKEYYRQITYFNSGDDIPL